MRLPLFSASEPGPAHKHPFTSLSQPEVVNPVGKTRISSGPFRGPSPLRISPGTRTGSPQAGIPQDQTGAVGGLEKPTHIEPG